MWGFSYLKTLMNKLLGWYAVIVTVILMAAISTRIKPYDYQVYIDLDSAYIFDNNVLIGTTAHGKGGIDSVILKDNL